MKLWNTWSLSRLLNAYLSTPDQRQADAKREVIFEKHLHPLQVKIVAQKFRIRYRAGFEPFPPVDHTHCEAADVLMEAHVKVLVAMEVQWEARHGAPDDTENRAPKPIEDLADYTATVTRQTFTEHLDRKNPAWRSMKQAICYVLRTRREYFASSEEVNPAYCCLKGQTAPAIGNPQTVPYSARWRELEETPLRALKELRPTDGSLHTPKGKEAALVRILLWVGHPVRVNDMTGLFLELTGNPPVTADGEGNNPSVTGKDPIDPFDLLPGKGLSPEQEVYYKALFARHWVAFQHLNTLDMKKTLALTWETKDGKDLSFVHLLAEWQAAKPSQMGAECGWEDLHWDTLWPGLAFSNTEAASLLRKTNAAVRVQRCKALYLVESEVALWN